MSVNVTIRDLLEAGCHFGHQTRYWNTKMAPYIFGRRNNIHIINLEKTIVMYRRALRFVRTLSANQGNIMFVGTKRAAIDIVESESTRCGMSYVNHRWLGGMLTNFKTVRQSTKKLQNMEADVVAGLYDRLAKKEALCNERKLGKLRRSLSGIVEMNGLPDALFIIDVGYHHIALAEAKKLGIPVIALVDTNNSPEGVDFIIPCNDDSSRALRLCTRGIADAVLLGRADSAHMAAAALSNDSNEKEGLESIAVVEDPSLQFLDPEAPSVVN